MLIGNSNTCNQDSSSARLSAPSKTYPGLVGRMYYTYVNSGDRTYVLFENGQLENRKTCGKKILGGRSGSRLTGQEEKVLSFFPNIPRVFSINLKLHKNPQFRARQCRSTGRCLLGDWLLAVSNASMTDSTSTCLIMNRRADYWLFDPLYRCWTYLICIHNAMTS